MAQIPTAYPLHWPPNYPRTRSVIKSQFKTSVSGALKNVQASIAAFSKDSGKQVSELTISSNYSLTTPSPKDAGVAVYFTWDGISTCIAVDRYAKIEENLQAIHHVIEAERGEKLETALRLAQAELMSLHVQFGDKDNALKHSKALREADKVLAPNQPDEEKLCPVCYHPPCDKCPTCKDAPGADVSPCKTCGGAENFEVNYKGVWEKCPHCKGTGIEPADG